MMEKLLAEIDSDKSINQESPLGRGGETHSAEDSFVKFDTRQMRHFSIEDIALDNTIRSYREERAKYHRIIKSGIKFAEFSLELSKKQKRLTFFSSGHKKLKILHLNQERSIASASIIAAMGLPLVLPANPLVLHGKLRQPQDRKQAQGTLLQGHLQEEGPGPREAQQKPLGAFPPHRQAGERRESQLLRGSEALLEAGGARGGVAGARADNDGPDKEAQGDEQRVPEGRHGDLEVQEVQVSGRSEQG
ncbi:hypothetical protein HWI79_1938 [Cryptosporidium felis]|nr:hypothetical protein HWI79_1938 [Cryptosporidium felis]